MTNTQAAVLCVAGCSRYQHTSSNGDKSMGLHCTPTLQYGLANHYLYAGAIANFNVRKYFYKNEWIFNFKVA